MSHAGDEESESMNSMASSTGLLREEGNAGNQRDDMPFCGCLTIKYYQPYFDVDTKDITSRVGSALFYCRANSGENFMALTADKPDAYGPFWVSTSVRAL